MPRPRKYPGVTDAGKICPQCATAKPWDEFYAYSGARDGHMSYCKPCHLARMTARRAAKHREVLAIERRSREKRRAAGLRCPISPEMALRGQQRHRARHGDRVKARAAFAAEVRAGRIQRQPCEVCGSPNVEGHHDDYSKPLEVRWLCKTHHGERHRQYA